MKKKLTPFESLTQIFLKLQMNKWFGPRAIFNKQDLLILLKSKEFMEDIKKLRKDKLKIPKLDIETDLTPIDIENNIAEDSDWLNTQGQKYIKFFEKQISKILTKYQLPENFREWIEGYLLYGKPPKYIPLYNTDLVNQIMRNPNEAKRIGLTSQEKKYLKFIVTEKLGIKKKPNKKLGKAYRQFLKLLAESKNKRRRLKTLNIPIKILTKPSKEEYYDEVEGKWIKEKYTYKRLATDLFEDIDYTGLQKKANLLRQQKRRLLKKFPFKAK